MAIARLHGGPLDGQVLPLDDAEQDSLIAPYGATQIIYRRNGDAINTGTSDGPTEVAFWFVESSDDITPSDD
ncbi:response regulator [Microbacterium sp. A82]|uniref:response regulator n=1 Tax=unclassified Microbacterium TaxID=2609290 RepID=UPI003F2CB8BE